MQNTSATWKTLAANQGTRVEAKAIINGVEYTGIEPPVITRGLLQNGLEVGNVVSATCSLTLDTDNSIPKSAEVQIKTRLVGGTEEEPVYSEWIPQGTFYISKRIIDPITGLRRFECYDALLKSNAVLEEVPWTDESGRPITTESGEVIMFSAAFPRDMKSLVYDIAYILDIQIDSRTVINEGSQYKIVELPDGSTIRDALSVIAQAHGANWIVTPDNKLRLVPVVDLDDIDTADNVVEIEAVVGNYYVGERGTVTGIRVAMEGAPAIIGNESDLVVDVSVSGMVAAELQDWLIGLKYAPYTFGNAFYDIAAELGDYIRFGDIESVLYSETVTLGHTMHGDISAHDSAEMSDEYPYVSYGDKAVIMSKAYVREATQRLNDSLNQEEIFNRLTDHGVAQGLIMYDGQLYINAEYIRAGTVVSNLLLASILTIGGVNDGNGSIQILDENGNVIGTWDKNGISVKKGSITGGTINGATLTLGGNNNTSGTLTVNDASNKPIGIWDKDGLTLNKGSINGPSIILGGSNNASGSMTVRDANGNTIGTWNKDGISVKSGSITGGTINGATLTLGGSNNASGTLTVKDSSGNTIGTWDNSGITLYKGSIAGPSVTLGGSSNASGTLTVKDANGNTIGTWNNNGINLNNGNFSVDSTGALVAKKADISGMLQNYEIVDGIDETVTIVRGSVSIFNDHKLALIIYGSQSYNHTRTECHLVGNSDISIGTQGQDGMGGGRISIYTSGNLSETTEYTGTVEIKTSNLTLLHRRGEETFTVNENDGFVLHSDLTLNGNCHIASDDGTVIIEASNFIFQYDSDTDCFTVNEYDGFDLCDDLTVRGNFYVSDGYAKSKVITTDQYADRILYCYETPSPLFGDVGEAVIGDDGLCYVTIDPIFAQTITTDNYQVFLQRYGAGDCYVQERKGGWFVVAGTPGLAFGWEIKGKQADIADVGLRRLDRNDEKFTVPTQTYGEDAAKHIDDIRKEREAA